MLKRDLEMIKMKSCTKQADTQKQRDRQTDRRTLRKQYLPTYAGVNKLYSYSIKILISTNNF